MNLLQLFKNIRPFVRPYRLLVALTLILTIISAGVEDVAVLSNTFSGTDTGLRFKSAPGRGGKTARIGIAAKGTTQMIHDISISDCTFFCTEKVAELSGKEAFGEGSIKLENVKLL